MAYNLQDTRTISFQTSDDLSGSQFRFVRLGTDSYAHACGATGIAMGILENAPSAPVNNISGVTGPGQYACTVSIDGVTRLEVNNAYAIGTLLCPAADHSGKGASIAAGGTAYLYGRAIALQASAADGDVIAVKLIGPYLAGDPVGSQGTTGSNGVQGITGYQGITGASL